MTTQVVPGRIPEWTLGWRMQRALAEADIKVKDIADELEVGESTVSRWLGDRGGVKPIYLRQWAMRCGVDYDWLKDGKTGQHGPGGGVPQIK